MFSVNKKNKGYNSHDTLFRVQFRQVKVYFYSIQLQYVFYISSLSLSISYFTKYVKAYHRYNMSFDTKSTNIYAKSIQYNTLEAKSQI